MATLYRRSAEGCERLEIEPENEKYFTLEELYSLLDCELVEVIPSRFNSTLFIVDEEGRLNGKLYNPLATEVMWEHGINTTIVGNVVMCRKREFR